MGVDVAVCVAVAVCVYVAVGDGVAVTVGADHAPSVSAMPQAVPAHSSTASAARPTTTRARDGQVFVRNIITFGANPFASTGRFYNESRSLAIHSIGVSLTRCQMPSIWRWSTFLAEACTRLSALGECAPQDVVDLDLQFPGSHGVGQKGSSTPRGTR